MFSNRISRQIVCFSITDWLVYKMPCVIISQFLSSINAKIKKNERNVINMFTKKQIQAANYTSIVEYCHATGIDLDENGKTIRGVEHNSLVIRPEHNAWYWNSRQKGGVGAVNFVENYELDSENYGKELSKGEKFKLAVSKVLKSGASIITPDDAEKLAEAQKKPFKLNKKEFVHQTNRADQYLNSVRKISKPTLKYLENQNLLKQDTYGNAVFLWQDPIDKKIHGATKQGTIVDHQKFGKRGTFKMIEPNSEYKHSFNFDTPDSTRSNKPPRHIRFFEAPIDAISFYDLSKRRGRELKDTRLVAMDGLKDEVYKAHVQKWMKQLTDYDKTHPGYLKRDKSKAIQNISIGLCTDNDEAGQGFADKHMYLKINKMMTPSKKYGKDWNDVLKRDVEGAKIKTYTPAQLNDLNTKIAKSNLSQAQKMISDYSSLKPDFIVGHVVHQNQEGNYYITPVKLNTLKKAYRQQINDVAGRELDQDKVEKTLDNMLQVASEETVKSQGKEFGPMAIYKLNQTMAQDSSPKNEQSIDETVDQMIKNPPEIDDN